MKTINFLVAVVLIALFMATLPLAVAEDAGKMLNIALGKEPDDLNPIAGTGHGEFYDVIKVYSGLLKSDDKLQAAPDIAESWDISPDGRTYTFHLREGIKWHDGTAFTADDILFTYELLRSGEWTSVFPASSEYEAIKDISILDPHTVTFTLNDPIVAFIERFSLPILPRHILEGQDLLKTDFWQEPIGTGPYKFVSWNKGEDLTFQSNPDFYGEAPRIGTLKYVFVPDESARINLLKSGEVDAIKIDLRSTESLKGANGVTVNSAPSANWYALNMPNRMWPFNMREVRQAISYAIDKQQILDTIFNGQGEISYGPFRQEDWIYNPDIVAAFDPERAKSLLADAGFKDTDGDGILDKDGKSLEFELVYTSDNSERKDISIAIKTDLAKMGINMELVGKSWDEISYDVFRDNVIIMAWGSPFDPDDQNYQNWNSKFIGKESWWNAASYSNPEVDGLLEEGRTTFDKEKRKEIYQKLQSILAEDQPVAFLIFSNYVYGLSDRITGIKPRNAPHGQGNNGGITGEIWWNVEEWQKE